MNTGTIVILKKIKNGDKFTLTKDADQETFEIINKLSNLGIIYKSSKYSYSIKFDQAHFLTKLIEFDNFETFQKWLEEKQSKSTKYNAENIIINSGSSNTILQNGNINSKDDKNDVTDKYRVEKWIAGITLVIAFLTFMFGDNIYKDIDISKDESTPTANIQDSSKVFFNKSITSVLPYLTGEPILDKGLFVEQHYGKFVLGGANVEDIKINARTSSGEKIDVRKNEDDNITVDIFTRPYIEFLYKNRVYVMEIYTLNSGSTFEYKLTSIEKATLKFINYEDLEKDFAP